MGDTQLLKKRLILKSIQKEKKTWAIVPQYQITLSDIKIIYFMCVYLMCIKIFILYKMHFHGQNVVTTTKKIQNKK